MKHHYGMTLLALALYLCVTGKAQAAVWTHPLIFDPAVTVEDLLSGDQINFTYEHRLPEHNQPIEIEKGILSITHEGNLNEGPRSEIWSLISPSGDILGLLSESEKGPVTDRFELPGRVLDQMEISHTDYFPFSFSEITAYNSEKFYLTASTLELHVEEVKQEIPNTPEPWSFWLLLAGLLWMRVMSGRPSFGSIQG